MARISHRASLILFLLTGCGTPRESTEERYRKALESLRYGDVESAAVQVQRAQKEISPRDGKGWPAAFSLLQAEVLTAQYQYRRALDILTPLRPDDRVAQQRHTMLQEYAQCLSQQEGRALRAAALSQLADRSGALGLRSLRVESLLRAGTCSVVAGRPEAAQQAFMTAERLAADQGEFDLQTAALGSLGFLHIRAHRYEEAALWAERSLQLAERLHANHLIAKNLVNLGLCYYKLGDYERAAPLLQRAGQLADRYGLLGDRQLALLNLGNLRWLSNDAEGAAVVYKQSLGLAEQVHNDEERSYLLSNLAETSLLQGQLGPAADYAQRALVLKRAHHDRQAELHSLLTLAKIDARRGHVRSASDLAGEVIKEGERPELRWEAHGLLAQLYKADPARAEQEFQAAMQLVEQSQQQISGEEHQIWFLSRLRELYDRYVQFLIEQQRPEDALRIADRSRSHLLAARVGLPIGATAPAWKPRELAARTAALFYSVTPHRTYAWLLTAHEMQTFQAPGEAELTPLIALHRQRILRSADLLVPEGTGDQLYRQLVAPVQAILSQVDRVVIVPDGPLHGINFETLVKSTPAGRHYWIEDLELAVAPSLALMRPESPRSVSGPILLIGDPLRQPDGPPELPMAGRELQAISAAFATAHQRLFTRAAATPDAYASAPLDSFRLIHFAAHAVANASNPLESAIVLSRGQNSYKLYARDVAQQRLRAELVSLSSCRSAGARAFAGEGLVGFAWAFLGSGAKRVVAGLWDVEDTATSVLMSDLYRGLAAGEAPGAALRSAKLALLHSRSAYAKPYYWAPFVLYTRAF